MITTQEHDRAYATVKRVTFEMADGQIIEIENNGPMSLISNLTVTNEVGTGDPMDWPLASGQYTTRYSMFIRINGSPDDSIRDVQEAFHR